MKMQQQERREHDDLQTGHGLPNSDGTVSDEDVKAIGGPDKKQTGAKDHSLDYHENKMPDGGVGGVQDHSDTTSDKARIRD
jgi:hypothetical protein